MQTNKILFDYTFAGQNGKEKRICVIHGDLTKIDSADVVVCSAFQGDYAPLYGTLIGALWRNKNILVKDLAHLVTMVVSLKAGKRPVMSLVHSLVTTI